MCLPLTVQLRPAIGKGKDWREVRRLPQIGGWQR